MFKKQPRIKNYKSCWCSQGHNHDSRAEARYCEQLALMKKAGEIDDYETQVRHNLEVNGKKVCSMIVDFKVYKDGGWYYVEVKGFATEVWKLKHKLFKALYPDLEYIVRDARSIK